MSTALRCSAKRASSWLNFSLFGFSLKAVEGAFGLSSAPFLAKKALGLEYRPEGGYLAC